MEDWARLFERKVRNAKKTEQILLGTMGGVVLAVPVALLSAEAVGGAIGATVFKLSGAAATSKGLAVLGGGAIASGGLGMAGGAATVSLLGAALGGVMGGVLANAYVKQVEGFGIERTKDGTGPAVIYLDGFLTQGRTDVSDWERGLTEFFPKNPWYYVGWEAKTLSALGRLIGGVSGKKALWVSLAKAAKRASRRAPESLGPMAKLVAGLDLARNPWHVACFKAQFTGIVLATIIRRVRKLEPVILVGHSLGARVIGFALEALAKDDARCVSQVHLLGGAIGAEPTKWWADCAGALAPGGRMINYHTENDSVLKYMYRAGMLFQSEPIGRSEIGAGSTAITDKDVSRWVEGHNDYKTKLLKILEVPS